MVYIQRSHKNHPHFSELVSLLDADLARRYGERQLQYTAHNRSGTIDFVVIAYDDSYPAGCGGLRK